MISNLSRRRILSLLAGAAATPAMANAPLVSLRPHGRDDGLLSRAGRPFEALIEEAGLNGPVGFAVADVTSGRVLEAHQGTLGLPPASVAKALTAIYALEALGPAHRFSTEIRALGPVQDGVVKGDLVLAGGGDPTLDTDGLAQLAANLKQAGIREVRGAFRVWGGVLPFARTIDGAQPEHVGYNPSVSGLNLNFNRIHFEWKRGKTDYDIRIDARSARFRPDVQMARMDVVTRKGPVYTYRDVGGRDEWTVARGALGKGGARWLPVRKPELYAGEVFQTFASSHGIRLRNPEPLEFPPGGPVVARIESAPLRVVLRDMLRWSTNLTAETVGLSATIARNGSVGSIPESAAEMSAWARETFGLAEVALVDHSGLGDRSRIAAADMAAVLVGVRNRMGIKPLLKSFPMRDAQRRVLRNHPVSVQAKTGTLNFVSGLAGFADLPDGTELAFAIFAADPDRRAELSRAERERPPGAAYWNRRAKDLQQALLERWGAVYSG